MLATSPPTEATVGVSMGIARSPTPGGVGPFVPTTSEAGEVRIIRPSRRTNAVTATVPRRLKGTSAT